MTGWDQKHSRLRLALDFLKRLLGRKPPAPPADPYAYVMAPVRRGPGGRSGAAAVAEVEDDSLRRYPPRCSS